MSPRYNIKKPSWTLETEPLASTSASNVGCSLALLQSLFFIFVTLAYWMFLLISADRTKLIISKYVPVLN